MTRCREPLAADFRQYYGLSLAGIKDSGIPLSEVAVLAVWLPRESRTANELNPDLAWDINSQLLAAIADGVHLLLWQNTADGSKGRNQPKPIQRPGVKKEPEAAKQIGTALPFEAARARLGFNI